MGSTTRNHDDYRNQLSPPLNDAIESLSKPLLRALVRDICVNVPRALDYTADQLFVGYDYINDDGQYDSEISSAYTSEEHEFEAAERARNNQAEEDGKQNNAPPAIVTSTKRLKVRYVRCENCKEKFDIVTNTKTSCRYHPGSFVVWRDIYPE
ncbi:hypothetical protein DTO166G4_4385 [Paecilomyces variotii]|nr:hypothetical protein DTO164E3_8802 [Paecilomyces variotii]KAJ9213940.1 hypothetical protein DTO166G4_4385 [Paecilomyces variotii]KAJ9231456.1 hypothetical protein DTO166G5_6788 [Paecilomyces variotii]KAJ9255272.1 hypothetical protein DTO195F2_6347 [Paecilomyces variotii]KAJ9287748.1 hypothetical protein DTO021C3_4553 [Paecilomyces variotii]